MNPIGQYATFISFFQTISSELASAIITIIVAILTSWITSKIECNKISKLNNKEYFISKFRDCDDKATDILNGITSFIFSLPEDRTESTQKILALKVKRWSNSIDIIAENELVGLYNLTNEVKNFKKLGREVSDIIRDETFYTILLKPIIPEKQSDPFSDRASLINFHTRLSSKCNELFIVLDEIITKLQKSA